MGAEANSSHSDDAGKVRYARVAELLGKEHIIAVAKAKSVLADQQDGQTGLARIWNEHTKCSVVFEPKLRKMHLAFPDASGKPRCCSIMNWVKDTLLVMLLLRWCCYSIHVPNHQPFLNKML